MRPRRMTARKSGKCKACGRAIEPGDPIYWCRGQGAWHVDCGTARLKHTLCTVCKGSGYKWNGVPCGSCDGTGSRKVQEFAKAGGHPRNEDGPCSDLGYEDACARACGL